ncbi:flavin reductase family protein [Deinococcus maricopensis]|uniref:Flavin reductase domain protein FMN-binding protein n=1 Tax=Deinococcus maricopensis (strain DSM 21211 / LMG 22137 / NRRL B-23946 / LB-34) TaxID=709986 RepID=E8UC21_DEIML|nr:flavin reductase family protein [Deinococcus maricopensis]ADV68682.1 flavin reductase domain protein FMN-binding protein [Deinococcus maricopensis DSM 21211]
MGIPAHEFRQTLGRFASGVTVITADHGGERRGMTASAFLSVSLEPPLILVSVATTAQMHAVLDGVDRFGVSILHASQRALSNHFGGRPDSALDIPWMDHEGLPLISGAIAQLVCRKVQVVPAGDHTLFIGEVQYSRYTDDDPLVYFRGQYHELG